MNLVDLFRPAVIDYRELSVGIKLRVLYYNDTDNESATGYFPVAGDTVTIQGMANNCSGCGEQCRSGGTSFWFVIDGKTDGNRNQYEEYSACYGTFETLDGKRLMQYESCRD